MNKFWRDIITIIIQILWEDYTLIVFLVFSIDMLIIYIPKRLRRLETIFLIIYLQRYIYIYINNSLKNAFLFSKRLGGHGSHGLPCSYAISNFLIWSQFLLSKNKCDTSDIIYSTIFLFILKLLIWTIVTGTISLST